VRWWGRGCGKALMRFLVGGLWERAVRVRGRRGDGILEAGGEREMMR